MNNTANIITDEVSKATGVSVLDIVSERRHPPFVTARHMCMVLLRELTPWSLPRIARALRRQDHTTVMHALRTWPDRAARDPLAQCILIAKPRAMSRLDETASGNVGA
jgi:chromosomal replication initiation ATPase DnaA